MAMSGARKQSRTGGGEPGLEGEAPPVRAHGSGKRYGAEERRRLLSELAASGESLRLFCERHGVTSATICKWKREVRAHGDAGLVAREPRRNPTGKTGRCRSAEERRAAVEAYQRSGMSCVDFGRTYGVSPWTLRTWVTRYRREGPKGLEPKKRGPKPGSSSGFKAITPGVQAEIVRTNVRFPEFGLKKVRDFLARFRGVRVSTGTVARTLESAGVERESAPRKRPKKRPVVRRFERARAGELWQSDITSFLLTRHSTRVYLTVFLDDFSRFVVSWALATNQRQDLVTDALMEGVSRFGKPKEVLTDQGRQYYAWRGKSDFQKLLVREGIEHVVSRAHHPETLGKCERLWETVNREFWERVRPQDVTDARERLSHWFKHYNYFRPHQGIDGLVPADRFFAAQDALKKTQTAALAANELDAALADTPRKGVYLFGQIGDEQVSLVGERGELVVQTSTGLRQRIGLEELGAPSTAQKEASDGSERDERSGSGERRGNDERSETATSHGQEAAEIRPAAAVSSRSEGAVEERNGGGASECPPRVHADPGAVAGEEAARRSGAGAFHPWAAGVAAQPAGAGGDALGTVAPAEVAAPQRGADDDTEGRRHARAEAEDRGAREADRESAIADSAPVEPARDQGRDVGEGGADGRDENARAESTASA
jgi:transposase InsO family protein/transposase-like protein